MTHIITVAAKRPRRIALAGLVAALVGGGVFMAMSDATASTVRGNLDSSAVSMTGAINAGLATTDSTAQVACGAGMVCIYPETNYNGIPYVRRASDSSTSLVNTPINDRTFSVINNGVSPRTARIYRSGSYSGSHTCIQPGGRIPDLQGYSVGQWGSSLSLNNNRCG